MKKFALVILVAVPLLSGCGTQSPRQDGSDSNSPSEDKACEDSDMIILQLADAQSEGYCLLEVEVLGVEPSPSVSCKSADELCHCELRVEPGTYSIKAEHADGRTADATFTYERPECGPFVYVLELSGPLRNDSCEMLCEKASDCPSTSIGPLCIGGCCAKD